MDVRKLQPFNITIISPYQTYYQGAALSLSAANHLGPFDVLANHTNFFSLLTGGIITLNTDKGQLQFQIARGVLQVNQHEVTLFADV